MFLNHSLFSLHTSISILHSSLLLIYLSFSFLLLSLLPLLCCKVGSLDGRFSQYCGYISAQSRASKDVTDIVECLEDATKGNTHSCTAYACMHQSTSKIIALPSGLTLGDQCDELLLDCFTDLIIRMYSTNPIQSPYIPHPLYPSFFPDSYFILMSISLFFPLPAGLLEMFMSRNNGKMPKQIIIYRDGVSDSQFGSILLSELPSIKGILQSCPCISYALT